ncbi:MAG: phosphoglucosamine mutase [Limnospira sp.]
MIVNRVTLPPSNSLFNSKTLSDRAWSSQSLPQPPQWGETHFRGRVGEFLNAPLALQIGYWSGQVLQASTSRPGPVILGQDSRPSSNLLAMSLSAGLAATGLEVWHLGLCPTPAVSHLTAAAGAVGGVMISADEGTPDQNGIKILGADGMPISPSLHYQIEAGVRGKGDLLGCNRLDSYRWGRQYHRPEWLGHYRQFLQDSRPPTDLCGLRIVLDLAWGAAAHLVPALFESWGAQVISLHDRPDGDRINIDCGSNSPDGLRRAVLESRADLGFAFSGDAGRVLAMDDRGEIVDGNHILYLWGTALKRRGQLPNRTVVSNPMANLAFERAWVASGGRLVRIRGNESHIHPEMLRLGAILGGDPSGSIFCRHYGGTGDSVLSALHLAALTREARMSLAQLKRESFQLYPQVGQTVSVKQCDHLLTWWECEPLWRAIERAETAMGNQGRVIVQVTANLEPQLRITVEASRVNIAHYWLEYLLSAVRRELPS